MVEWTSHGCLNSPALHCLQTQVFTKHLNKHSRHLEDVLIQSDLSWSHFILSSWGLSALLKGSAALGFKHTTFWSEGDYSTQTQFMTNKSYCTTCCLYASQQNLSGLKALDLLFKTIEHFCKVLWIILYAEHWHGVHALVWKVGSKTTLTEAK